MDVASILATKGRDVVTIEPQRALGDAAAVLAERGIGALIVMQAGSIAGILSERDVVRALARGGAATLADPVARHMTAKVVTATASTSIVGLMETMTRGRFRHVPVVEDGRLDGVVSIGDVVKHRLAEIEGETLALREYIATA